MKAKTYDGKDNAELNIDTPLITMIYEPACTMTETHK